MSDLKNDAGHPAKAVSEPQVEQDGGSYEPPRLQVIGTLFELTRGTTGASDGLGPGSAL